MIGNVLKKVIGSRNERELKRINAQYIDKINQLEPEISKLTDGELASKTAEFKSRLDNGEHLNNLIVESFAVVREVASRVVDMRHFDSQLVGGIVLHQGKICEMRTGEGKTLVATLPCYLNGLVGEGVHVVTVNDYLAKRDSDWMGAIYNKLGLSVGVIKHGINNEARKLAYGADITYATNNELAFDYLRDNMLISLDEMVQRRNFAIVDEVDSILIDEARTPLIISGAAQDSTDKYSRMNKVALKLIKNSEFYTIDEKAKAVMLSEVGIAAAEDELGIKNLYDPANIDILHHVQVAMKAHLLFSRDVDYLVKDGKAIIVDEFTGRLMPGRRWSDGVHQAIEAKEQLKVESENQTVATITFQNYFRLYNKLAGMTGTADTEAAEFAEIYNLEVLVIPTNQPMIREDQPDLIYKTEKEKGKALIEDIVDCSNRGQPVLVGTSSIAKSEQISGSLKKAKVQHSVLNAKYHEKEAEIVAQAGRLGVVTIATNMAGRGTDIVLGGNPEMMIKSQSIDEDQIKQQALLDKLRAECLAEREAVLKLGGLRIIGTERHESRRIDNQLRGRSGRQGDPGSSRFYISLQDDLIRIFGGEKIEAIMGKVWTEEGLPVEAKILSRSIENAQRMVEAHNFDMRKHLLEYDDVLSKQREVIYEQRLTLLDSETINATILDMAEQLLEEHIDHYLNNEESVDDLDLNGLVDTINRILNINMTLDDDRRIHFPDETILEHDDITFDNVYKKLGYYLNEVLVTSKADLKVQLWKDVQKYIALNIIDLNWKDHLLSMELLKEGIGLRGYAQKNPLTEYKREGMSLFVDMIERVRVDIITALTHTNIEDSQESSRQLGQKQKEESERLNTQLSRKSNQPTKEPQTYKRSVKKIGRNEPCHCGSGKKYKKCCMLN
ncbi:MAG: preprotein translocase subunit SecA [Nitrospinota bacterium]